MNDHFREIMEMKESEWISVKERLPKLNSDQLIVYGNAECDCHKTKESRVTVAEYNAVYEDLSDAGFRELGTTADLIVTHWMPLPEPPST